MNTTYNGGCRHLVFNISSNGLWENLKSPGVMFGYSLPLLEIQILTIFLSIIIIHMFLRCIGITQMASYIIAGFILGPQLFDLKEKSSGKLSPDRVVDGNIALKGVQLAGNILFTFFMTVKINRRLAFNNGPLPIVLGILTFIVPLFGGLSFRIFFTDNIDPLYMPPQIALAERTVIISTQSSVLLTTVTYFLSDLKILNSELGRLVLSASLINEILGVLVSVLAQCAGTYMTISPRIAYRDFTAVIAFLLIVFCVFKPAVKWIIERTPEDRPISDIYVHATILLALASAAFSTWFNMKYLLGPFFIGLIIPEGPPLGSALETKYEGLTMNLLLPASIAFSTMKCDLIKIIYAFDNISYNILLMLITLALKLTAAIAPCLSWKLPFKETMAISLLLCCKSFSEIFLYESTFDDKYISQATFTLLIVCALLSTGILPPVLTSLYDPKRKYVNYQKRNIMSLKPNSNLRILTCIHKPENISGAIAFLQLLSLPNLEHPISVTVLHLVKLIGKIIPILIPHNKGSSRLIDNSYIHTANLAFSLMESVTMTTFTALTHENLMQDEICRLSLDQATSMIIVPSGRKWTVDGEFESDDEALRRINVSLLEHAPCSIGILVDRGQFSRLGVTITVNIEVGVIFIGGKDDREALALVKRMRLHTRVNVTVIRLVTNEETDSTNWEYILDHEVLEDLKNSEFTDCFKYTERTVTGGPEVATTVISLSHDYDLMVVGRDHGIATPDFSGLTEWIELPELGVIGDLLAARDLNHRISVLVVQQQQQT